MKLIIILHDIRSAANVGSILRTADGLGIEKVICTGTTPYPIGDNDSRLPHVAQSAQRKIAKTALGAEESQTVESSEIQITIDRLKAESYAVYAIEQSEQSVPLQKFVPSTEKIGLIVGNEVTGITDDILSQCQQIIEIPMIGKKESYNVSIAAAIAMWEFSQHCR